MFAQEMTSKLKTINDDIFGQCNVAHYYVDSGYAIEGHIYIVKCLKLISHDSTVHDITQNGKQR